MAAAVAEICDLEEELLRRIGNLERERLRIETEIDALPVQQAEVITARYMDGMSWNRVSRATHYERSYVFRIHAAALKRLGKDATKCDY